MCVYILAIVRLPCMSWTHTQQHSHTHTLRADIWNQHSSLSFFNCSAMTWLDPRGSAKISWNFKYICVLLPFSFPFPNTFSSAASSPYVVLEHWQVTWAAGGFLEIKTTLETRNYLRTCIFIVHIYIFLMFFLYI